MRRAPGTPAVIAGAASLSYGGAEPPRGRPRPGAARPGSRPGSFVGLCVERSAEAVVGLLAILKTGGAYVPLDPDYPAERLALMMDDCDLRLLVVDETTRALLPRDLLAGRECLTPGETEEGERAGAPEAWTARPSRTSSTPRARPAGRKAWPSPHRAVVRLVRETNYVRLGPGDRVAQVANLSFDAADLRDLGRAAQRRHPGGDPARRRPVASGARRGPLASTGSPT